MSLNVEKFFQFTYESQIECGRIALTGTLWLQGFGRVVDIVVFDLKTGLKIFSCRNDLQLSVSENFVLERDRLLLWSGDKERKLLSLKFWL